MGTLCYYAALWLGAMALVQPLSALHIVLTALWMGYTRREAILGARAWGIALVSLGTVACLAGEVDAQAGSEVRVSGILWFMGLLVLVLLGLWGFRKPAVRMAIVSGVLFSLSAVAFKAVAAMDRTPWEWMAGALFLLGYAGGFLTMQAGFRRGGAGVVNALATGTNTALPMAAALWIFGEPVTPLAWVGVAAIVLGVLLVGRVRFGRHEKASPLV
jgi:drug/metabolite transporter (DMT)-like permease